MNNQITILDGFDNMDFDKVTLLLATAHWSPGVDIDTVKFRAMNSALVVGAFCDGVQVGYARVISDKSVFAYVADVFVEESYRHNGIAKDMMLYLLSHESLKDVRRWLLKSAADKLYKQVGFTPVIKSHRWMARGRELPVE